MICRSVVRVGIALLAVPIIGGVVLAGPAAQAGPAQPRAAGPPRALPLDGPPAKPRVCVSIRPSVSKVVAGDPYGYSVTVRNCGDVPAPATKVRVAMPRGVRIAGDSSGRCSSSSSRLSCSFGTVAYKKSRSVRLAAEPSPRLRAKSRLKAAARATCTRCAPRTDSTSSPVTRRADVSQQNDSHDHVLHLGDPLTILLKTRNAGPSEASDIVMDDTVPDRLSLRSVSAPRGVTCSRPSGRVVCRMARLAPGELVVTRLELVAPPGAGEGRTRNAVHTRAAEPDPDESNNRSGSVMNLLARPAGDGAGLDPGELDEGGVESAPGACATPAPAGQPVPPGCATPGGGGAGDGAGVEADGGPGTESADGCQTEGPGPRPTSGPCAPSGPRADAEGSLPFTGLKVAGLTAVALAIAGLGTLLVRAARRNRL